MKDAIAKGYLGTGQYYVIDGFASQEVANESRRSVNCAARHLGVSCSSKEAEDVQALTDGTWRLRFRIWPKNAGRRHVHKETGGDPSKLAYNPFARAEGPVVDDYGRPIAH